MVGSPDPVNSPCMPVPFVKMHGLGNDYVYVNCFDVDLAGIDVPALCREISDRHRGIGSDGLILIAPPETGIDADVRMIMYNADGSRGEMCGNGIRCVAKYAIDRLDQSRDPNQSRDRKGAVPAALINEQPLNNQQGHSGTKTINKVVTNPRHLNIQTDRGVLKLIAYLDDSGTVSHVRVDMGTPILTPVDIPMKFTGDRCIAEALEVAGHTLHITCVSMGNPHAVAFVNDLDEIDLTRIGPLVERHAWFPNRVNFHIARIHDRAEATMRTWERGSGITQACGTGACAVHVAGVLENRLGRSSHLHLPGGDLDIAWPEDDGSVFMTGPATEVFDAEWTV